MMRGSHIYLVAVVLAAMVCVLYLSHLYVLFFRAEQPDNNARETDRLAYGGSPTATARFNEGDGKRIMVTGGAGFLGSHLVDHLMRAGGRVMVVDNFFTGQRDNVAQWLNHPRFQLLEHDVTRPLLVEEVDEIYHLACPSSPPVYMAHPVFTINTNTLGTHNMLDPQVVPQTEEYRGYVNPVGSRASYDEGKRAAEAMVASYHRQYNLPVRIARISNSYGPRLPADGGGVVGTFIKQALQNKPIYIYGAGNQTRCLQYVSDAVEGLVGLMASPFPRPLNIAGTERYTVLELAHLVLHAIPGGSNSRIEKRPPREDDPKLRRPDITKAATILQWSPKVPLKEGLKPTIAYFQKQLKKSPTRASDYHST